MRIITDINGTLALCWHCAEHFVSVYFISSSWPLYGLGTVIISTLLRQEKQAKVGYIIALNSLLLCDRN